MNIILLFADGTPNVPGGWIGLIAIVLGAGGFTKIIEHLTNTFRFKKENEVLKKDNAELRALIEKQNKDFEESLDKIKEENKSCKADLKKEYDEVIQSLKDENKEQSKKIEEITAELNKERTELKILIAQIMAIDAKDGEDFKVSSLLNKNNDA